jgi:hypothetical protein
MKDLDGEILALLPEHLPNFLREDLARSVMRIDDVVAAFELDVLELGDVEVLVDDLGVSDFGNGQPPWGVVRLRSADNGPRG